MTLPLNRRNPPPVPDFNPANRNPRRFGYVPGSNLLHQLLSEKGLRLRTPLTYPRAIDSSHWSIDNIQNFPQVAETICLFYTKSTEGNYYQDIDSQLGALEAKAAGMITLYFHFFRRNIDGKLQFNYFKSKTENLITQIGGKKIVIVDMETLDGVGNTVGNNNFKAFCNEAHAAGYLVGLYVNPADWVLFGLGSWVNLYVEFYILAHWKSGNNPTKPTGMDAAKVAMQQEGVYNLHSWIQPIPGLVPQMDANLLLWPLAQWETFSGQKYEPFKPPAPPPAPGVLMFTNPNQINIRSSPETTPTNDVGDLPKNSVITALEVRATDNNSVWVRFAPKSEWLTKTVPEYWVAIIHDNQGILLQWQVSP